MPINNIGGYKGQSQMQRPPKEKIKGCQGQSQTQRAPEEKIKAVSPFTAEDIAYIKSTYFDNDSRYDDIFETHHTRKKPDYADLRAKAGCIAVYALTLLGVTLGMIEEQNQNVNPDTAYYESYDAENNEQELHVGDDTIYYATEADENTTSISPEAKELLSDLEATQGSAWKNFDTLCEQFGFDRKEMAETITHYCNDKEWGEGYISPLLLCAQMYHESQYMEKAGNIRNNAGLAGLGKDNVDEVNKIYGTDYTYNDRLNPKKSLEMMVLYLKHCYLETDYSDYGMLAMYHTGDSEAIEDKDGKDYVESVLEAVNMEYNTSDGFGDSETFEERGSFGGGASRGGGFGSSRR